MRQRANPGPIDYLISTVVVGAITVGPMYALTLLLFMIVLFLVGRPGMTGLLNIAHGTAGFWDYFWPAVMFLGISIASGLAASAVIRLINKAAKKLPQKSN